MFVPRDIDNPYENDLLAYVVEGSPAYLAGIRNDDLLLKINDFDAAQWRTDPELKNMGHSFEGRYGRSVALTLQRGERIYEAKIELIDFFAEENKTPRKR